MNEIIAGGVTAPYYAVLLFAIYSFFGWLIEVAYRSTSQRRFVNAGFLHGPFVPIYGFGAGRVLSLDHLATGQHFLVKLLLYGVVLSAVEYLVGYLFERAFRLKLWDYSDGRFHLHGRISLLFSLFWTFMAFVFATMIHPAVSRHVTAFDGNTARVASSILVAYFGIDVLLSAASIGAFRKKIAYLYSEYFNLSNVEIEGILRSFSRHRRAFPDLNQTIDRNINREIKGKIQTFMKTVRFRIMSELEGRKPLGREFNDAVRDILRHEEFLKLKGFFHHNSSIYEHAVSVAYFSYRVCKLLRLDYRSAARGALLHDFFLYDWRNHDVPDLPKEKYHGIEHPAIALENAERHFELNDIERDIIIKHMWPLTITPPRYKESFIVTFADKYLSSKEFLDDFRNHRDLARIRGGRAKRDVKTRERRSRESGSSRGAKGKKKSGRRGDET